MSRGNGGIGLLLVGVVIGAAVLGGYLVLTGQQDVNGDALCQQRFDEGWTAENVDQQLMDQNVSIDCTNGTATRTIGVNVSVEVNA